MVNNAIKYFKILPLGFFVLWLSVASAQIDRDGNPVSWNLNDHLLNSGIWQVQTAIDAQSLLQADELQSEDRSVPMRFALSRSVNYDISSSGRWTNLPNGDRIWVLGIESQGAFSIGITFSHFKIPLGAKLYIYADDRNDVIGPFTSANNRINQLMTAPPVRGEKIVIEYYEPNAFRGQGEIQVHSFAHAYRDLNDLTQVTSNNCFESLEDASNTKIKNASSSVMMMIVDNGQRIATATLVNNSSQDGTPYAITARSAMIGNSASWVFLFNVSNERCRHGSSSCWNNAICGAQVIQSDSESLLALLKLKGSPKSEWSAFNSGWNLAQLNEYTECTSIQHGGGVPQSYSITTSVNSDALWNDRTVIAVDEWDLGTTTLGSIGSPLFDEEFNLVAVYLGGNKKCAGAGNDYYSPLSSAWNKFSPYLDAFGTSGDRLSGLYSESSIQNSGQQMQVYLFPNPAKDWIYVQNDGEMPIDKIEVYDALGKIVLQLRPRVPTIDISMLPDGVYVMTFHAGEQVFTSRLLVR